MISLRASGIYSYRICVFHFTVILFMKTLVRLKIFYDRIFYVFYIKLFMFNRFFLTSRVLTSISILLLFLIVNSICSVIVNIRERINS